MTNPDPTAHAAGNSPETQASSLSGVVAVLQRLDSYYALPSIGSDKGHALRDDLRAALDGLPEHDIPSLVENVFEEQPNHLKIDLLSALASSRHADVLVSRSAELRRRFYAADLMGATFPRDVLLRGLSDPCTEIAFSCAVRLAGEPFAELDGQSKRQVCAVLLQSLVESWRERQHFSKSLSRFVELRYDEAVPFLVGLAATGRSGERAASIQALLDMERSPEVTAPVRNALQSDNGHLLVVAIAAATRLRLRDSLTTIARHVRSHNAQIRAEALKAVELLADDEDLTEYLRPVFSAHGADAKQAIAIAGDHKWQAAEQDLAAIAQTLADKTLKRAVVARSETIALLRRRFLSSVRIPAFIIAGMVLFVLLLRLLWLVFGASIPVGAFLWKFSVGICAIYACLAVPYVLIKVRGEKVAEPEMYPALRKSLASIRGERPRPLFTREKWELFLGSRKWA